MQLIIALWALLSYCSIKIKIATDYFFIEKTAFVFKETLSHFRRGEDLKETRE